MIKKYSSKIWKNGVCLCSGIALALCVCANAYGGSGLTSAPLNPEFKKAQRNGFKTAVTSEGRKLGHIPAPINLKLVPPVRKSSKTYPAAYDLRDVDKVTSVKDQDPYGTCWSFATMGSTESCIMPVLPNPDFSENNLVNKDGFDLGFDDGGNSYMGAAYLTRWGGPADETEDPYPNPDGSPAAITVQKHMQNVIFYGDRPHFTDNEIIKDIITTHGAAYISFYWADEYYNAANYAFYNDVTLPADGNHAVTLIGWDDNFSAANFNIAPPGDGAFLIKNSWGTAWGDQGYFWISYYDTSFGSVTCFYGSEATDNYPGVCQYDPFGWISSVGYENDHAWGANIFTAQTGGDLEAVGFYAVAPNAAYNVKIYTGVDAGQPSSGTLSDATASGTILIPGYYTIALSSPVTISQGTRFSVVIDITTPDYGWPLPYEYAEEGYSSAATASPGQSFVSSDGAEWMDLTDYDPTANLCIKAFGPSASGGGGDSPIYATVGTEFEIECPAGIFEKKPSVYITGGNLGTKKKNVKVLKSGQCPEYPCPTITCQWNTKILPGTYFLYVKRAVKGEKPAPDLITDNFQVKPPVITEVTDNPPVGGIRTVDLAGVYLGTAKPKLNLRYTIIDSHGKASQKKLAVKLTDYGMTNCSFSVKESALQKLRDKGVDAFYIVFKNAIDVDDSGWYIE